MSPRHQTVPPPDLRQELERQVQQTIEADASSRVRASRDRRPASAEILQRLDITIPRPSRITPASRPQRPTRPTYTVRDGPTSDPVTWVYGPPSTSWPPTTTAPVTQLV